MNFDSISKPAICYGVAGLVAVGLFFGTTSMMDQMKVNASNHNGIPSSAEVVSGQVESSSSSASSSSASSDGVDESSSGSASSGATAPAVGDEKTVDKKPDADVYHVEWGDTLSGISGQVGVSVDALAHANEIDNVDLIYADSSIVVPEVVTKVSE